MKSLPFYLFIIVIVAFACNRTEKNITNHTGNKAFDSSYGMVVADTIIYEVNVINTNPDDYWANECLRGLDHKALIDNFFSMVYAGKAFAFNHETNEKLTIAQVDKLEKDQDFDRQKIGMIQFKEAWYIDPSETEMTKKVLSVVLGMGVYSNLGEFKGNRAIIRIELP